MQRGMYDPDGVSVVGTICAQLNMELKRHNEKVKRHRLIAIFVGFFIGVVIVLGVKCLKIY